MAVVVDQKSLRAALNGPAGLNAVLSLEVEGARHTAMARQLQRGMRGGVVHVDFLVVDPDEVVTAEVPVHMVGEALVVTRSGGIVEQHLFGLAVIAKPAAIPTHIDVDVSGLAPGDMIRVADLVLPAGVEADVDGSEPVVSTVVASEGDGEGESEGAAGPAASGD